MHSLNLIYFVCFYIFVVPPKMEKKLNYDTFFVSNFFYQDFFKTAQSFFVSALSFLKKYNRSVYTKKWEMFVSNFVAIKINFWHRKINMQIASKLILYSLVVPGVKRIILWKSRVITILIFFSLNHSHAQLQSTV